MPKPSGQNRSALSVATGRRRRLVFTLFGDTFTIDVHERVEMIDLATRKRIPPAKWNLGNGNVRIIHGSTPRYFETRDDTGERIRHYDGLIRSDVLN